MSSFTKIPKLPVAQLEDMMLLHFNNMIDNNEVSVTENQNFFAMYMYWIFKSDKLVERDIVVNFVLDKKLQDAHAHVEWVDNYGFNIYIDRRLTKTIDPEMFNFAIILAGHEIRHIEQSLTSLSWETNLAAERDEIEDLTRFKTRRNGKKAQKLIDTLSAELEYDHFVERDAREASFIYAKKLLTNLIAKATGALKNYLQEMMQVVEEEESSEQEFGAGSAKRIKDLMRRAENMDINLDRVNNVNRLKSKALRIK